MRRALLAMLLLVCSRALPAQLVNGMVVDGARTLLAESWDTRATAKERLYCVSRWAVDFAGYVYVLKVEPATTPEHATAYGVSGECLVSSWPTIHIHTPNTCDFVVRDSVLTPVRCKPGGLDAYQCFPSEQDRRTLVAMNAPFSAVQCDRHAFVFYFNPFFRTGISSPDKPDSPTHR